jgi:glycosyltransferase involved in cell wall biosynthesis
MENITFSIVIPVYNKEKYVKRSINSVLNQTYTNFELIIVDDGSTDNSLSIASSFKDERIKIINQENAGVSNARNNGVKFSSSNWVAFLDADDEYHENFLSSINEFIINSCMSNISFIGTNYYINNINRKAVNSFNKSGVFDYFQLFSNQISPNCSSSTVVNKRYFLEIGGFPEKVKQFEDWISWFKLATIGEFLFIFNPLAIYHLDPNSVSKVKRSNIEYFKDSSFFIESISQIKKVVANNPQKVNHLNRILSQFSLNVSLTLVSTGSKLFAVKIFRKASLRLLFFEKRELLLLFFYHLIFPRYLKKQISFLSKHLIFSEN